MALVLLDIFTEVVLAQIAKSKLDTHGIPAFLFDEHISGNIYPSFANFGVRLMVSEDDFEEAGAVLKEDAGD
jgi:hypothetical protein